MILGTEEGQGIAALGSRHKLRTARRTPHSPLAPFSPPDYHPRPDQPKEPTFSQVSPSPALPLPQSRYTGVGSLFHHDPAAAAAFVLERFPDFPFWPQLPARGESMIEQALAEPSETSIPGFFELERRLAGTAPAFVKGQVAGPETLRKAGRGTYDDMAARVEENAVWQVRRIHALGRTAVISIDEPSWTEPLGPASRGIASRMVAGIRASGAFVGFHCCGRAPWFDILGFRPDFVNPDVSAGAAPFLAEFGQAVRGHLSSDGWIGWGLVPTTRPPGQAREIVKDFLAAIKPLGDVKRVLERSFVTPACGLGTLTPVQGEEVLRVLYEISRFLRCDHLGLPAR